MLQFQCKIWSKSVKWQWKWMFDIIDSGRYLIHLHDRKKVITHKESIFLNQYGCHRWHQWLVNQDNWTLEEILQQEWFVEAFYPKKWSSSPSFADRINWSRLYDFVRANLYVRDSFHWHQKHLRITKPHSSSQTRDFFELISQVATKGEGNAVKDAISIGCWQGCDGKVAVEILKW